MTMRAAALLLGLAVLAAPLPAAATGLLDVVDRYAPVSPPQPTADPERIEVVELFFYGCPHCHDFEPPLKEWAASAPEYVSFRRVPAVFRQSWVPFARAFYAAKQLGELERFHGALFDALHEDNRRLASRELLADFAASLGIAREAFLESYDSFAVESQVRRAIALTRGSGITGVPAMMVNGKYRTSPSMAGSFEGVLQVVDVLVQEEGRDRGLVPAGED
jgi:thiol:disulfide interchange protein DsbA